MLMVGNTVELPEMTNGEPIYSTPGNLPKFISL